MRVGFLNQTTNRLSARDDLSTEMRAQASLFANPWRLPRLRRGKRIGHISQRSFHFQSLLFPRGLYFRQSGFLTKSSMTKSNENLRLSVFERDVPTLPPKHPRERRVCARATNVRLRTSWFWGGGGGDASPARPRRKTTGNRPRACCCSPFAEKGGRSGTKRGRKRGGRGKGTLGEGKSVIDEE